MQVTVPAGSKPKGYAGGEGLPLASETQRLLFFSCEKRRTSEHPISVRKNFVKQVDAR
jgi:hypothetical protein